MKAKKTRKTISVILALLMAMAMATPAFAANDEREDPNNVFLTELKNYAEMFYPEYADRVDYTQVGGFDRQDAATRISQYPREAFRLPDMQALRGPIAIVYTEAELDAALNDTTVNTIMIANNIVLTTDHDCNHSVTITPYLVSSVTLTSAPGKRHIEIVGIGTPTDPIALAFSNVILYGNDTSGGIAVLDADAVIYNATIQHCRSTSGGSAIHAKNIEWNIQQQMMEQTGSLVVYGGTFTENCGSIGAIASIGSIKVTDATIRENTCSGVFAMNISEDVAEANFADVTICENETTGNGGGLCLFIMKASVSGTSLIQENTADQYGGGIFANMCEIDIIDASICDNILDDDGFENVFGVGVMVYGKLTMTDTEVGYNMTASGFGGGAGVAVFTMENSGITYLGDETATISGCEISSNDFNIDQTYSENPDEWSTLYANEPDFNASVLIPFSGGGVYICDLDAVITDCTIEYNHAIYGAGVYYGYKDHASPASLDLTIGGSEICENYASCAGGGIHAWRVSFVGPGYSKVNSNITGESFTPPEYYIGKGGGIFIQPNGYLGTPLGVVEIKHNIAGIHGAGVSLSVGVNVSASFFLLESYHYLEDNRLVSSIGTIENYFIELP